MKILLHVTQKGDLVCVLKLQLHLKISIHSIHKQTTGIIFETWQNDSPS
jgi:hypothetical protein